MEGDGQRVNREYEAHKNRISRIIRGIKQGWQRVHRGKDSASSSRGENKEEVMKKVTYIFINGILNKAGNINNWNTRACMWIDEKTNFKAERYEYESDIIFRRFGQEKRVNDIQTIINRLSQGDIILVGHSNGCDLIERLVKRYTHYFKEIHLIAGASERNFKTNGFNEALRDRKIGEIFIYMSRYDNALKKAKWSTRLFGWLGLGYGYIGLVGPSKIAKDVKFKVHTIDMKRDHQDWFSTQNFDETMKLLTHIK